MKQQSAQQVVRIGPADTSTPLSKNQKTFNRLTKKIAEQEQLIAQTRASIDKGRQRILKDLEPLRLEYGKLRADMVRLFDQLYSHYKWTKTEQKKLTFLITDTAYGLIENGHEDLKEIYDRYDDGDGVEAAMADADGAEELRSVAETLFGIKFDPDGDYSDFQKVRDHINEQIRQKNETAQQQQEEAAERRAKKPKTEKQLARDAKKQAEELNVTKAVRALYMDLVKAFHPDRETDPAEKERKTAIMQRVTAAYEKSDLMALFRLQLEFERIDQDHLERLADSQLQYYNKILKQQVDELDLQLSNLAMEIQMMSGDGPFGFSSIYALDMAISSDTSEMKRATKALKKDLKTLTDPVALKAWLKTYRIPKDDDFDFDGLDFGGFRMR